MRRFSDALKGILFSQNSFDLEIAKYEEILRWSNLLQKISSFAGAEAVQNNMYAFGTNV